jgi:hypothetical protein
MTNLTSLVSLTPALSFGTMMDRTLEFEQIISARFRQKARSMPPPVAPRVLAPRNKNRAAAMQNFLDILSASPSEDIETVHELYKVAETTTLTAFKRAENNQAKQYWSEIMRAIQSKYDTYLKKKLKAETMLAPTTTTTTTAAAAAASTMITVVHGREQQQQQETRRIAMISIQRKLEEISTVFLILQSHIDRQMPLIDSLERNVDSLSIRVDASRRELEDAAPRLYHNTLRNYYCCYSICRLPTTFSARLRFCVCAIVLCHCFLFIIGVI